MKKSDVSIALIIPDFDHGGEEKRVVFFANSYINYFRRVFLIAPAGLSDDLIHKDVRRLKIDVRKLSSIPKILKFVNQEGIDIVQGHKRATLLSLFLCEKFLSKKVFFNFDNIYLNNNKVCSFISPTRNVYLSDVLKEFYNKFLYDKNNFTINMGGDFLNKLPQELVLLSRDEYEISSDTVVLLSLGRLAPQKNHRMLLNALSKLSNKNFLCLIVGSGPLEKALKEQSKALCLDKNVKFLGHKTDIESILNISDVLVQSSVFEGFPNVFIEAVSVGVPIVSTDVGSARTLVKDNGKLVSSNDVEGFASAIDSVIDRLFYFKDRAEDMRLSVYFSQFSKEKMLDGYISYINTLKDE